MATMNGLTAYRDEDGIHVTIELGTLPLLAESGGTGGTGGHRAAR